MRLGLVAALVCGGATLAYATPFPAAWLQKHGEGYLIPDTWSARGLRYGRPELSALIGRVAGRVAREMPGATLYIGDLSLKTGGWTQWHRSHRNGCDADLLFYALDEDGYPIRPPAEMVCFDDAGIAWLPDGTRLTFDIERNWALVRALLEEPRAQVVRIFVSAGLRAQLLAYATGIDAPRGVIARAAAVLGQPSDSAAHDDHFHVRIAPPELDSQRVVAKARPGKAVKPAKARPRPKNLARHRRR
jgi:penicillin-insensitive murein endopeptidase